MGRYNSRITAVVFKDGAGTPASLTITPSDGDFSSGAENDSNVEKVAVQNRGQFDCLVETTDIEQELSMTLHMKNEELTHATLGRVTDWVKKTGSFSGLTSVDPNVWAWIVEVTMNDGTTSTTKTFPYVAGMIAMSEGFPQNTFSLSMTNYQQPTEA